MIRTRKEKEEKKCFYENRRKKLYKARIRLNQQQSVYGRLKKKLINKS